MLVNPCPPSWRSTTSKIGASPIGNNGFGKTVVYGPSRVPRPPARITACLEGEVRCAFEAAAPFSCWLLVLGFIAIRLKWSEGVGEGETVRAPANLRPGGHPSGSEPRRSAFNSCDRKISRATAGQIRVAGAERIPKPLLL